MSESGDSFEEIGLMQSGLSRSASINEQESSNLNNSTMSNSTDQSKTGQLKELLFELAWETRRAIIDHLDQHTKLLSGLIIEADAREAMRKANGDLMVTLLNLPVKVGGRWRRFESLERGPANGLNEVVLELNPDVRSRIVDTLMTNHHVALLGADLVENECKSKLAEQNNDMIFELLKLKSRTVAVPSDSPTSNGDHLIEQPMTVQSASCPTVGEVKGILKEELQKVAGELSKQISDQSSVIGSLEENVRGLNIKLDESKEVVDETTVTLELKDIEAVLAGSKKSTWSQRFYCKGIPWNCFAGLHVEDETEYLHVSLNYDRTIDRGSWRIVTTFEIRLLGSNSGPVGLVEVCKDHEFKNPGEFNGYGWKRFITIDKLRSGSFIKGDTIKLRVHLTITSIKRFTD